MNKNTVEDRNFRHLVLDVVWFGIAWVTVARFLSVYAIRVGATPTELSWITAGPQLGMLIASFVSVWWRNRFEDSLQAIFLPTFLFRFSLLLLAFTPIFPATWQPLWIIISVTLPSLPQGVSSVVFFGLLKETTPEHRMTSLLGRRGLFVNLMLGTGALFFGLWLEHVPYPYNYAMMFTIAFGAAMMSQWHLHKVKTLDPEAAKPQPHERVYPLHNANFRGIISLTMVSHIAFFSVFPVLTLRLVEELGATEGYMAIFSVIELASGAFLAIFFSRLVQRYGNRKMVGVAMLSTSIAAIIVAFVPSLPLALIAAAFTGAGWGTVEIGIIGYFTNNIPTRDAAYYTRTFTQSIWLSVFIAPFIGTNLAEIGVSLSMILILGALLRLGAGLIALYGLPFNANKPRLIQQATGD